MPERLGPVEEKAHYSTQAQRQRMLIDLLDLKMDGFKERFCDRVRQDQKPTMVGCESGISTGAWARPALTFRGCHMTTPNDYLMHELLHGLSLVNSLLEDACDSGRNVEHGPALFDTKPEIRIACEAAMRSVFDAYQVVGRYHLVGSSAPQAWASDGNRDVPDLDHAIALIEDLNEGATDGSMVSTYCGSIAIDKLPAHLQECSVCGADEHLQAQARQP